jgi:hypothetical protein
VTQLTITKDETFWFVVESALNTALKDDVFNMHSIHVVAKVRDEISTALNEHAGNPSQSQF